MIMLRRPLTTLALLSVSCALVLAQAAGKPPATPPAQDPQQPVFRTRVDSISVDASVTDKNGQPVIDLKAEDFEIREAGKLQTVETFRLIQIPENEPVGVEAAQPILSESQMARETANPENRLFIIFLDDYHTRKGNSLHVRQQLASFVSTLGPHDLVALMYPLSPASTAIFSREHEGTAQGIMHFIGRKMEYDPQNAYERQFVNQPPEVQEQIRNDLVIGTMKSTCSMLSTLREGRKTVVYVSEGLSGNVPMGAHTTGTGFPSRPTTLTPAQQQAIANQQLSQEFFNTTDLLSRMRDVFSICSRSNTSIVALDPRGLATGEFGAADQVSQDQDRRALQDTTDTLRILADETNGRAIIGTNDPLPALKKMVHELSAYYLLGYTSTLAPRDGKFHEIQVKVNRKDVEVRAKKGYWAYTEDEVKKAAAGPKPGPPEEIAEALGELAGVVEPTSHHRVGLWIGAVRGDTERPQITVVWEAAAGSPDTPADRVERVSLTVTAAGGEVLFQGPVARDQAVYTPTGRVTFAAPAGPMRIKMAVENVRGQRLDNEDITEVVPDLTTAAATITAPQVFRARTALDITRLRTSTTALPTVTRQFSRTERLFLRFEAYGPAGTLPEVSMRWLNKMGDPLGTPPPVALANKPNPNQFETDISLAPFPSGDYLLEITATTGNDKTVKIIGFRITG
jgi:VWFA-related protein